MKKVTAYRCEHCGKIYLQEKKCKEHEENTCARNPQKKPLCYDCDHYEGNLFWDEMEEVDSIIGHNYKGQEIHFKKKFSPNKCDKKKCKLYNNVRLSEEMQKALSEKGFKPMPTPQSGGCEHYSPCIILNDNDLWK